MSAKYFRIIALQCVFTLLIFISFIYFFVKYDSGQLKNQINNIGQTLAFTIQEDVNISEGVLASFAYNYEIDPDLDEGKFRTLAKHYLKVNPDIIYVQRKDKETTTLMVYPDTYNYTLGATLMGRPEVEKAVLKAIKDKIVTANAPFILKDTDGLLGLVIRYPLYNGETFDGFFAVVMSVDKFLKSIIDPELMKDYNISFFDDKQKLFWGYDGPHKGHVYINDISIMDNYWTIYVSLKKYMPAATMEFVTITSILFLLIVGLLVVMQIRLIKRDKKIQHISSSKKELEKVKESYSLALDSANDALWEWNIETGAIYTSDKWVEINGNEKGCRGVDAILHKKNIHPEDYDQALFALEACLSGEKLTFDIAYRITDPLGNCRWVQNRGKVHIDGRDDTTIMAGCISNITERKQAEIRLAESEATVRKKLKAIFEPEGDISTLELSDIMDIEVMQSMMEEFYRATGMLGAVLDLSGKVLVAFGWQDICTKFHRCHPDTAKNCLESDTVLTQGVPPGTFRAYHCKNNMWDMVTPLMVGDQHVGNVFFGQFFYEDETPDDELFRTQARQHGFDESEYLAALARVPRFSREKVDAGMQFYARLATIVTTLSYNAIKQARMLAERERLRNDLKELNTELELKVDQRTAQLEATNKELEAFSYSVSHDLRAPLRHINGYVDLLNNRFREALPEKAGHYLNQVADSASQMGTLIDDLLQFSRTGRQELRQADLDMNTVVQEVLEKLKPDTKNRNISWTVAELPRVYGDYALLKQVWVNLLDNAVKYTRYKDEAEIEVGYTRQDDHWEFFLRDNGAGFDMQYAHKLFGVFQRLHSSAQFEGTGIGLANVQRIVHKHGGRVRSEAQPEKGATFYFTLPRVSFAEGGSSCSN